MKETAKDIFKIFQDYQKGKTRDEVHHDVRMMAMIFEFLSEIEDRLDELNETVNKTLYKNDLYLTQKQIELELRLDTIEKKLDEKRS